MVTHEAPGASYADRVHVLRDGQFVGTIDAGGRGETERVASEYLRLSAEGVGPGSAQDGYEIIVFLTSNLQVGHITVVPHGCIVHHERLVGSLDQHPAQWLHHALAADGSVHSSETI